jgi:uncharacterized protein
MRSSAHRRGRLHLGLAGAGLLVLLVAPLALGAAGFPTPRGLVNDFAGVLDAPAEARIIALAEGVRRDTGVELAVVTIPSYAPEASLDDYAVGLFQAWGIGKSREDNGLLLIMALAERRVRIEVGYGLEPIVTDGRAGAIIDAEILPAFRRGEYGEGLVRGAEALAQLVSAPAAPAENPSSREEFWMAVLLLGGLLFLAWLAQSRRRRSRWGWWDGGAWGGSGGFGGFGGSGGGFGGFGGGASGGGGAGRGW